MANELVEQATVVLPDKILQAMDPKKLGPMAQEIISKESNMMLVSTRGYKTVAERLKAQREALVEERLLREEMGELHEAQEAAKMIRDQQREIDGLQRRALAQGKNAVAATAKPAMAVDAKGSR